MRRELGQGRTSKAICPERLLLLLKETTEEERGFLQKSRRNHDSVSYVVQSHLREIQPKPREYHNVVPQ